MNLADVAEPLILADGRKIDPETGKVVKEGRRSISVPNNTEMKEKQVELQRRLADLPIPVERMNGLSVILTYYLMGYPAEDIAIATGLSKEQLGNIIMSDAFTELRQGVVESISKMDVDDIKMVLKGNAKVAAVRMGELIESDDEFVSLAASKDALDRDGFRPKDVVEHRVKMEGGLTIEYIKRSEASEDTAIDVPFRNLTIEEELNDNQ